MLPLPFIAWASRCKLILWLNTKFYNVDCTKNFLMESFRARALEFPGITHRPCLWLQVPEWEEVRHSGPRKVKMGATEQKGRMKETEEHTEMCRLPSWPHGHFWCASVLINPIPATWMSTSVSACTCLGSYGKSRDVRVSVVWLPVALWRNV